MTNKRTFRLWIINVISFTLFILLSITGLINWLILPKGYGVRTECLGSLRHFFIEVHQWTALAFVIIIAVHVILHWGYIKTNIRKYRK
jgi:hypothetical protein